MRLAIISLVLLSACSHVPPMPVVEFSAEYPKNYLIMHHGSPEAFRTARCYELLDIKDENAEFNAEHRLVQLLRERVSMLHRCSASEFPRLRLIYHAGFGICIDCGSTRKDPQSGFAFIDLKSLPTESEDDVVAAEWQYWRGGSAELMLQQLVFDLTNLVINGLEKPPPEPGPNLSLERTLPARLPGSTMSMAACKAAQLGR